MRVEREGDRREITLAAQLQHPHIVAVFDSGETADDDLWFTTPYICWVP
ncbi:MAG: hypothetical protein IPK33_05825 [Gemmatimonadetes bacterium]|nr:hypothetical protein [Gemmatimonadota bacterium]